MAKRKARMSDSEVLKHYTPGGPVPPASSEAGEQPALVKRLLEQSRGSKAKFKKPELAVDRVMGRRNSAVKPKKGRT